MGKVTQKDIVHFNELYYRYKNKARVARETGFSASTVSRYIDPNWKPINEEIIKHFLINYHRTRTSTTCRNLWVW